MMKYRTESRGSYGSDHFFPAIELIDQLSASGDLVMSAQCLNEFSAVALRRGIPISEVRTKVEMLRDLGQVLPLTDVMNRGGAGSGRASHVFTLGRADLGRGETG
jgi:hypothetical protein